MTTSDCRRLERTVENMILVGMHYSTNQNGVKTTTLHTADEFNSYYTNKDAGRGCVGQKVETIYVGEYDCTSLKIGMEIDISYEKAMKTANGIYQPVKKIVVLNAKQ